MIQPLVELYGGCMVVLKVHTGVLHREYDNYMTQPLVELYGGCMVVLTVS